MGIYISTNSKIRSFTSIACIVEVFSPDILIYFVIYLLNAMKGVRRGACLSLDWARKCFLACIVFAQIRGASRQKIPSANRVG